MEIRKLLNIARPVGGGSGIGARKKLTAGFGKVFLQEIDLLPGIGQDGKFLGGEERIAEKKKIGRGWWRLAARTRKKSERTGDRNGDVFYPVVRLGIGNKERLEIEAVEVLIGKNDYARVFGDEICYGPQESLIEVSAATISGFERTDRQGKRIPIGSCGGVEFIGAAELDERSLGRSNDPEEGALLAQPIEQDGCVLATGEFFGPIGLGRRGLGDKILGTCRAV